MAETTRISAQVKTPSGLSLRIEGAEPKVFADWLAGCAILDNPRVHRGHVGLTVEALEVELL